MEQASEFNLSKRVVELGEDAIVAEIDAVATTPQVPNMANQKAIARATTIAMIGVLATPLFGLMAGDEKLWEKLQSLVEAGRPAKIQSSVLAVDTAVLSVRSKSASPGIKELFEQAAMEHLARLHHTFNSWSERNQELMGSVSLKLLVDSSGNVVRVEPVDAHVNDANFIKTVVHDAREWKFPKGGTDATEITVPLLFIPKGMDPEMIVQWERKVRGKPRETNPSKPLPVAPPIASKPSVVVAAAAAVKAKADAKAFPVVIANRQLAIRDNPRYSASTVREVAEATPLSILENRGDWLKVRTAQGGVTGFTRKEYVSPANG